MRFQRESLIIKNSTNLYLFIFSNIFLPTSRLSATRSKCSSTNATTCTNSNSCSNNSSSSNNPTASIGRTICRKTTKRQTSAKPTEASRSRPAAGRRQPPTCGTTTTRTRVSARRRTPTSGPNWRSVTPCRMVALRSQMGEGLRGATVGRAAAKM